MLNPPPPPKKPHSCHPWRRGFWHQLLLAASALSLLVVACFPAAVAVRGGPFLRVLFLAVASPRLRQEIRLTLRILPQFGKALLLLLAIFLLYAVLGLSLFSPYSDDKADAQEAALYFRDFRTAFASVWQLFLVRDALCRVVGNVDVLISFPLILCPPPTPSHFTRQNNTHSTGRSRAS